ncbi:MAG: alpha/beta hydrolase [Gammaproteobacteria bacterium]|nr:MAG: alpha/beta hydrolase [Gammaproteobacteria bacterium]
MTKQDFDLKTDHLSTKFLKLSKYSVALISGSAFLALFWVVASFIYRDISLFNYWSGAGFLLGVANGFFIQAIYSRVKFFYQLNIKLFIVVVLLAELALGLLLIGPYIWVKLRFIPTSNIHSICCETPLDYGAARFEDMRLKTSDGATIAGWYVKPTAKSGNVIILIHGYGYDRRGTDFQTRVLIEAGYGVLLYDLRDHGESESNGSLNIYNRMQICASDLLQMVNYLKQKPEVQHIGVVGISLGAFATLNSLPETLNSFSGLWMDGLRFENFGAQGSMNTPNEYLRRVFDYQSRWIASLTAKTSIPVAPPTFAQIIPTIKRPKLMLVSSGLDKSERATNEKLIPLLGENQQLWIIENAWHIGGRFDAPVEYREKLLAFFESAFSKG